MKIEEFRRVRITFRKVGDMRFLSHLDVMRTMDRALRRTGLPIRYTEGMNPKVKMAFSTALPLGLESLAESMEIQVRREVTLKEVRERLAAELPEGLRPVGVVSLYAREKWRPSEILYEISGDLPSSEEIEATLARDRIPVTRRKKELDLRPLLAGLRRDGDRLAVAIVWTEQGTARPDDLLRALGRDPDEYRVVKVGTVFESSLGERIVNAHEP